jgi:AcrR family transcriptional regulator
VSERDAQEGESTLGLPRLPPGRHGLSRDFVVKNQRDRLTAGIISAVAHSGYHEASVSDICRAAGVSRRTFYSYFSSKQECYLQAFDLIGDYLTQALTEAGAEEGDWTAALRARLAAMLETFAVNPDLVRFFLIAPLRAGEEIAVRHRLALERILRILTQGKPVDGSARHPSPAIEQALVGGMTALITGRVEKGEGEKLTDLLPDLVELFLTPYIGREEAARAAQGRS